MSQIWKTSAYEAVALLRSTFDQLIASKGAFGIKSIEIAPFGKFEPWDALRVQRHLYDCEIALGRYADALAVAATAWWPWAGAPRPSRCSNATSRPTDGGALSAAASESWAAATFET